MKNHKVFKISSEPFFPDVLSGLLWELNIEGIIRREPDSAAAELRMMII